MERTARLLVVDDEEWNRDVLSRRLERSGYSVETAQDGQQALAFLETHPFDLVLLDNMMPGLSGLDVLRSIRRKRSGAELPVIMVTAQCESENVVAALQEGANDYVTKPVDFTVTLARIAAQLAQHSDFATQRTIDQMTSLPNRVWLEERLRAIVAERRPCTLLILEPDQFDRAEESLSPGAAGRLLVAIAARLRTLAQRLSGVPVRCGEYHFALVIEGALDSACPRQVALCVQTEFQQPLRVDEESVFVTLTTGIATYTGENDEGPFRNAYAALRHARNRGTGSYEVFSTELRKHDLDALRLESDLREAIQRREFVVYYQPKVDLRSGGIEGFEALVRWQRPGHGVVMPGDFIGMAENTGLIIDIGKQVLDRACQDTAELRNSDPQVTVSVNISGRQFAQPDLVGQIYDALVKSGLPASALRLELTETVFVEDSRAASQVLQRLHETGVGLKLDDFGTGYSSLSYLHQLPFDTLKIDRAFVSRLGSGPESLAIVRAIVALAKSLHMSVVAEGIETEEQLRLLRELGCDAGQGFWFSRPLELKRFRELLAGWNQRAA